MERREEKRINYRRFEDRRVALMLAIHEILFEEPEGAPRSQSILGAIGDNFGTDRSAFLSVFNSDPVHVRIEASDGDWEVVPGETVIEGRGIETLIDIHRGSPGTLSLTNVRRPSVFPAEAWDALWKELPGTPTMALLSIEVRPEKAEPRLLWLQQVSYSREWSSRDRDLIEEVARLLAKAADKECDSA